MRICWTNRESTGTLGARADRVGIRGIRRAPGTRLMRIQDGGSGLVDDTAILLALPIGTERFCVYEGHVPHSREGPVRRGQVWKDKKRIVHAHIVAGAHGLVGRETGTGRAGAASPSRMKIGRGDIVHRRIR